MGRAMQISSPVRAMGRRDHVIGTSMGSNNRAHGQRAATPSQEEYNLDNPVSNSALHRCCRFYLLFKRKCVSVGKKIGSSKLINATFQKESLRDCREDLVARGLEHGK
jgi:hypothetical protein